MSTLRSRPQLALALALVALGAGACGDPAPFPVEHWMSRLGSDDEARRQEAIEALGRLGREDPERIGALLVGMLERRGEQAVLGVRVEPDFTGVSPDERERLLPLMALGVRERLRLAGGTVSRVVAEPGAIDAYVVRPGAAKDVEATQALVMAEAARPGAIDLRVELPPPFAPSAERPVSPWTGEPAAYEAWLAAEQALLISARGAAETYRPSVPGRRLLPRARGGTVEETGPVPVLEPVDAAERFSEADLVFVPQDDVGVPALSVSAGPARTAAFRTFLKSHAGLILWLVVDGEAAFWTRIHVEVPAAVVFRVRAPSLGEGRTRVAEITALAALGRFPVPVKVSAKPRAPLIPVDHPVCKAIVAIGPAVEPRLEALVAKDATWAPLVEALKDGILKSRAVQR